jgi:hypothetical protein
MTEDRATKHVEWLRAAFADILGVSDAGGLVEVTPAMLDNLAATAVRESYNYIVASALNGRTEFKASDDDA